MKCRNIALVVILSAVSGLAQSKSVTPTATDKATLTKDPQAISWIQSALAQLGPVQAALAYTDSVATGTLAVAVGPKPESWPIVLKTKGTRMIRIETQRPKGTSTRIVSNGVGATQNPDGSIRKLQANNTQTERVMHIPLFSLLSEYADPSVSVENGGSAAINGASVNVVSLRPLLYPDSSQLAWDGTTTKTSFSIDSTTGLVVKITYQDFAENNVNARIAVDVLLSDYRSVNDVMVPFRQAIYSDGKLESVLILNNVSFNVGLTDDEFKLPQ